MSAKVFCIGLNQENQGVRTFDPDLIRKGKRQDATPISPQGAVGVAQFEGVNQFGMV